MKTETHPQGTLCKRSNLAFGPRSRMVSPMQGGGSNHHTACPPRNGGRGGGGGGPVWTLLRHYCSLGQKDVDNTSPRVPDDGRAGVWRPAGTPGSPLDVRPFVAYVIIR